MTLNSAMMLVPGIVVAFYWTRVVEMAIRARRRSRRGANFIPREKTGRLLRAVWIPMVAMWVVLPFVTALSDSLPVALSPLHRSISLSAIGAAACVVAMLGTLNCWSQMGRNWRMGIDPSERNPLIIAGAFAYVRHPIYALSTLLMLGTVVVIASPLMILVGLTHISLLQWEARREERHLLKVHGEDYAIYCRSVNRWIPRLTPASQGETV